VSVPAALILLSVGFLLGDAASNPLPTRQGVGACVVLLVNCFVWGATL
jgi:hypothetical protein